MHSEMIFLSRRADAHRVHSSFCVFNDDVVGWISIVCLFLCSASPFGTLLLLTYCSIFIVFRESQSSNLRKYLARNLKSFSTAKIPSSPTRLATLEIYPFNERDAIHQSACFSYSSPRFLQFVFRPVVRFYKHLEWLLKMRICNETDTKSWVTTTSFHW